MADENEKTRIEVDVLKGKVRLDNVPVYDDVRKPIVTGADVINNVLRIAETVTGVSADFVERYLGQFRDRYRSGVESIPEEHRQQPHFRLTCSVLREAAYAAEERDLQDLFANLLLTGSDTRTFKKAHPGFANTINQLTWFDAQVLVQVRDYGWKVPIDNVLGCNDGESVVTGIVLTNLKRLGLIDWEYHGARSLSPHFLSSRFAREMNSPIRHRHDLGGYGVHDITGGIEHATERLVEDLKGAARGNSHTRRNCRYGIWCALLQRVPAKYPELTPSRRRLTA